MQGAKRFNGRSGLRMALLVAMLLAGAGAASADVLATYNKTTVNDAGKLYDMLGKYVSFPANAGTIGYLDAAATYGKQFGFQLPGMASVASFSIQQVAGSHKRFHDIEVYYGDGIHTNFSLADDLGAQTFTFASPVATDYLFFDCTSFYTGGDDNIGIWEVIVNGTSLPSAVNLNRQPGVTVAAENLAGYGTLAAATDGQTAAYASDAYRVLWVFDASDPDTLTVTYPAAKTVSSIGVHVYIDNSDRPHPKSFTLSYTGGSQVLNLAQGMTYTRFLLSAPVSTTFLKITFPTGSGNYYTGANPYYGLTEFQAFGPTGPAFPIENGAASGMTTNSAVLPGTVNVDLTGSDKVEVWWGKVSGTWTASNVWNGPVTSPSNFTYTATGLDSDTNYYFTYSVVTAGPVRVWAQTTNSFKTLAPPAPSPVTWLGFDTTTQGNWHDGTGNDLVYGQDGYWLIYGGGVGWKSTPFPPSYATVGDPVTDAAAYSTTASSTAAKHLLIPGISLHEDGIWYRNGGGSSFTFDVAITDANTHRLAIYCWAYEGGGVQIEALDAGNGDAVLDTRSPSNSDYANGVYFVWNIKGHLKFRVTGMGVRPFASGLFFGAPSTPWPVENRTVTQRGTDSATLPGRVNVDLGASDKTEVWWGQVSGTWTASNVWDGPVTAPSNFTHNAAGLDINTTYYFTYAIVTNSGANRVWAQTTNSFKTLPPPENYVWDDGAGGNDHYWKTLANWNSDVTDAVMFDSGSGSTFTVPAGGTVYCDADTTFGAPLTVNTGATLMVTAHKTGEDYDRLATASDLRLNGGTVRLFCSGGFLKGACQVNADSYIDNPRPDDWRTFRIVSTLSGTGGLTLSTTTNSSAQYSIIWMSGSNAAYSGHIVITNSGVVRACADPAYNGTGNPDPLGRGSVTVCSGSILSFYSGTYTNIAFKTGSRLELSGTDGCIPTTTLSNNVHVGEAGVPGWTTIATLWYGPLAGEIHLDSDVSLENQSGGRDPDVSANLIGAKTLRVLFGRTATVTDHPMKLSGDNSGFTGKVLVDAMNSYTNRGLRLNSLKALGDKTCKLEITANGGKVEYELPALTNVNVLGLKLGATTIPGSFHGTAYNIAATDPGTGVNFANYFTGAAGETITVFDMRPRGTVLILR